MEERYLPLSTPGRLNTKCYTQLDRYLPLSTPRRLISPVDPKPHNHGLFPTPTRL